MSSLGESSGSKLVKAIVSREQGKDKEFVERKITLLRQARKG
jgi:hypothetical protein